MLLCRLLGGLGNQMFIYAFARAMSLKGYTVLLDAVLFRDSLCEEVSKKKDLMVCNTGGGEREG